MTTQFRLLREPLIHFLLMGACLFAIFNAINGDVAADDGNTIEVTQEKLLSFIQYRARKFDPDDTARQLDTMSEQQRQQLTDAFVREEVLYREAKALALDSNDYVARQRLIQQMRYLTESFIQVTIDDSDAAVKKYLADNSDRYRKPAEATFTHVFFSTAQRRAAEAKVLAEKQLKQLNNDNILFHQGIGYGERFLYHRNYVNKEADHIASHFGEPMQQAVFALSPSDTQWHGPYQSPYGYHLVMLTQNTPTAMPSLAEVKGRVVSDIYREQQQEVVNKAIEQLISRYQVNTPKEIASIEPVRSSGDSTQLAVAQQP